MSNTKLSFSTYLQYVKECVAMNICTRCSTCKEPIWPDSVHTCSTVQHDYTLYNVAEELNPIFKRRKAN